MGFLDHAPEVPRAFDRARGRDVAEPFGDISITAQAVLEGAAGCSNYLAALIAREAAWLHTALGKEAPLEGVWTGLAADGAGLRQAKARAALTIALAEVSGAWSLETCTAALSAFAREAIVLALDLAFAQVMARRALPATDAPYGGLAVFAMGKLGADELNYSSDIDLIVLFDEMAYEPADRMAARAVLIKVTQTLCKLLSDQTDQGHVFRTDLRLRPDPSVTPVCQAMGAAERYYESLGRTWERAAWIKARVVAGDLRAGEAFLGTLAPFVWRKHLDFAAIQDAHDMRGRIWAHRELGGVQPLEGYNVKLGRGGIREIEFFTQTRQLIYGGRDSDLRARATVPSLETLTDKGWVEPPVRDALRAAYRAHRHVEHRLQMFENAQTHDLPNTPEGFERLAAFLARPSGAALRAELQARFDQVAALTDAFFDRGTVQAPPAAWDGFADPAKAARLATAWEGLPAFRSARARELFAALIPRLAQALALGQDPDDALMQFDGFLRGLPAGVQVFALFEANPQLLDLLCDICATAPALASYLGRNAGVFDAVLSGAFFAPLPGCTAYGAALGAVLSEAGDYEAKLDAARVWQKEQHFRIGVHLLRGLVDAPQAMEAYSNLAEASLAALLPHVTQMFAGRHGQVPGASLGLIAMGRLGSREMTGASDLDLIVVYDTPPQAVSDGARPLPANTYFARLTQAVIAAMTAPTAKGALYQTDMRLRPSGRKGPVAVTLAGFLDYQATQAWTWEHLALTRARVIAGPAPLRRRVEEGIAQTLSQPRPRAALAQEVRDMRARLMREKGAQGVWALKSGEGGLLDIDLMAQALALHAGAPASPHPGVLLCAAGDTWVGAEGRTALAQARATLSALDLAARLVGEAGLEVASLGAGAQALLRRVAGLGDGADLNDVVTRARADAARVIGRALDQIDSA
ncbi:MAG: bifunctional [glutamine synthetase] adenylyltransferase/[glutamine synthetase]-adenylyl-L-tyrosine phosphorylase [Pseudomonadota bacterium]